MHNSRIVHDPSIEVMRAHFSARNIQWNDFPSFHMNHSILNLELPVDAQNAAARHGEAVSFEDIGSDDHIGDSGFILEREKDEAFGSAWPLACNYAASDADRLPIRAALKFGGGQDAFALKLSTMVGHGVRAGSKASSCVISCQALFVIHLFEWRFGSCFYACTAG